MFRPSEREALNKLWSITLPEIAPFLDITTSDKRPPADIDPSFMNMDFVFSDVN